MRIIRDISYGKTEYHYGDLYIPDSKSDSIPMAMLIHGGGWSSMDKSDMNGVCLFLCNLGIAVYNINYTLSSVKPWPACGDDCLSAAEFLLSGKANHNDSFDYNSLTIIGASAGGHLALMTGLRLPQENIAAIISISGISAPASDMALHPDRYSSLFGHFPDKNELLTAFPVSLLKGNVPPILCTHSKFDSVVPPESTMEFIRTGQVNDIDIESYFYDREDEGHAIWIPNSNPHCLYADLEKVISSFLEKVLN